MRIATIVPGFGGTFYCGNCIRDNSCIKAFKEEGHKTVRLPMYLPITRNEISETTRTPVFYGAVNLFLKHEFPVLRRMPEWMENMLNSGPALKLASRFAGSSRASGLAGLTLSMLENTEPFLQQELQRLIRFMNEHVQPDIVHCSNVLLMGIAGKIRKYTGVPVICSLQDEDVWIDAMPEVMRDRIWKVMAKKVTQVDGLIAVSEYFAGIMKERMQIPAHKLHIAYSGVDPARFPQYKPSLDPPVIGFLSRLCPENGLGILLDAFIKLKSAVDFRELKLRITGGMTGDDRSYIRKQIKKLKKHHFLKDVTFHEDYTSSGLPSFFEGLSVLSVPVIRGEAFGLYQIESLASGIPLVQPAVGAFPEIIKATDGGFLYYPNTSDALAEKLQAVLKNPEILFLKSENGKKAVADQFNCRFQARKTIDIYRQIIQQFKP
jgi:glycosyltransferase involved in cell wall biosynthesis